MTQYLHRIGYDPGSAQWRAAWPLIAADTAKIVANVARDGVNLHLTFGNGMLMLGPPGVRPALVLYAPGTPPLSRWVVEPVFTGGAPWDAAVCAVLLRARMRAPGTVAIASDGTWDREWLPARHIVARWFAAAVLDGSPDPLVPASRVHLPAVAP